MFKRVLTMTLLSLVTSAATTMTVQAQQTTSASAPLSATVTAGISMTSTGTTNFGSFGNTAHTESINPVSPQSGKSVAVFTITGTGGTTLNFSCSNGTSMTNGSGGTMLFTPSFAMITGAPGSTLTQTAFACPGFSTSLSGGTVSLHLGGSINVAANQQPGAYSGTFTLQLSYP